MKVAIDSGPLSSGDSFRGIGMYTRELIDALRLIANKNPKDFKLDVVDFRNTNLSKYDIVHYPNFHPYFLTLPYSLLNPFRKKPKVVVTIHDLIQLVYPQAYPPGLRGKIKFVIQKFLIQRVDAVLTITETSKKDIVRFLNIPAENIINVSGGPRKIYKHIEDNDVLKKVTDKYNLPRKFILYIGDVNFNKNIMMLADACKIVNIPLVIAGKQAVSRDIDFEHIENRSFKNFLDKYQDDPNVLRLGYVADEDLVPIANLATAYCQPSLYEGFGMPVLEAMACGTPVVIAKTQALVEIAGGAALIAEPTDPTDFAEKIVSIVNDSSEKVGLVRAGYARVKDFSWQNSAEYTYEVYKKLFLKTKVNVK